MTHQTVTEVTARIRARSESSRAEYLDRIHTAADEGPARGNLGCSNLAHGFASASSPDKDLLRSTRKPNVAIVTAYNDMLSAHKPYETYPRQLKQAVISGGGIAQVAGGVPAMCDGITQGRAGMELSLFSRDVIAMSTAIALSHDMFDRALLLGVCDKIVPGLLIGALSFGHLPTMLVPAGPMESGLPNAEKSRIRQLFAEGKVGRDELLDAEAASYHSPGTCTFYGTANSNQLLMEVLGLHLAGATFVNPGTPLRDALTDEAGRRIVGLRTPIGELIDERAIVNAVVALLATGGSANHTLHLPAIAAAAGIDLRWEDLDALSAVVPTLAHIYPSGKADINHFHAAGGTALLIRELLDAGLLHPDARTVMDTTLAESYTGEPALVDGELAWSPGAEESGDKRVLRSVADPFAADGGLRVLDGDLGRAVIKVSAVAPEHLTVRAPARVFDDQQAFQDAFRAGELDRDFVAVVRFHGPRAKGMPELHKLIPPLGVLQDRGHQVALVTDGRLSGASGKIPAAIHLTPEAAAGGPLARIADGDVVALDATRGTLSVEIPADRETAAIPPPAAGTGRELFAAMRAAAGRADRGASVFGERAS